MKIISLGYTCYVKSLIKQTTFDNETDIFDWMNSFYFNKIILSIENKFDIFESVIRSPLEIDLKTTNMVFFNQDYFFRLPHETNLRDSITTYNRRFERFSSYKNDNNNYLFIRMINTGQYGISAENIEENYSDEIFNKIIKFLPVNSKILLITNQKLSSEHRSKISNRFIVIDDAINPEHIAYGEYLHHKTKIIKCYQDCFNYIQNNFSALNSSIIYTFIKNENIGI